MNNDAFLVLANGQVFEGKSFGAAGSVTGEAVFTTGMAGYLETLTDPSYYGQIVVQTFPLIGNYGVIPADFESPACRLRAYVVRSKCDVPSNFRSEGTLDSFLKKNGVVGLYDIDTRALTKVLREAGVMNALLVSGDFEAAAAVRKALKDDRAKAALLKKIKSFKIINAVQAVSESAAEIVPTAQDPKAAAPSEKEKSGKAISEAGTQSFASTASFNAGKIRGDCTERGRRGCGKRVVLWDFGAKANIERELAKRGLDVVRVPAALSAKDILSLEPCGIMLSNGPGDPAENTEIIKNIKALCKSGVPIFGICLGHQLLALARGAKTKKLKYGHRGENQPVKRLSTGRVYISSQNHGYAVENESLPRGAVLSFVNTNDGTCEGITYTDMPAFSVQFHPEAAAGPLDLNFLFDDFINLINDHSYFNNFKTPYKAVDAASYFADAIRVTKREKNAKTAKAKKTGTQRAVVHKAKTAKARG